MASKDEQELRNAARDGDLDLMDKLVKRGVAVNSGKKTKK
jgi:hypothetical protein